MAELAWISFKKAAPEREYVAMLSYLPLKSFWSLPQFFYYTRRIQTQLKSAHGLVGYSLLTHVLVKKFWTVSVWEDEIALTDFVHNQPHRETMMILRRYMGGTDFVRWKVKGAAVPPSWQEALERIRAPAPSG